MSSWTRLIEAVLFASTEPVPEADLAARLPADQSLLSVLDELQSDYAGRGIVLHKYGKGWAFRTAPDLEATLVIEQPIEKRLSRAAVETLAIIAYHQPVTRASSASESTGPPAPRQQTI